jgi:hypothetical protein
MVRGLISVKQRAKNDQPQGLPVSIVFHDRAQRQRQHRSAFITTENAGGQEI